MALFSSSFVFTPDPISFRSLLSVFLARSVFPRAIRRNYRQNGKTFPADPAVSIITVPALLLPLDVQVIVCDPLFRARPFFPAAGLPTTTRGTNLCPFRGPCYIHEFNLHFPGFSAGFAAWKFVTITAVGNNG